MSPSSVSLEHPGHAADLEQVALDLHRCFSGISLPRLPLAQRQVHIQLGWELFDDPLSPGKILVARFYDRSAADPVRLAGKLTAALRARPRAGVLLDCTHPIHGVSLRPAYQRCGLMRAFLLEVLLKHLPPRSGVRAAAGPGSAAGVTLEYFRSYMQQRRGEPWLDSPAGRDWWQSLPERDDLDWEVAGGYPPLFGLLRSAGLGLHLEPSGAVLGLPPGDHPDTPPEPPTRHPFLGNF